MAKQRFQLKRKEYELNKIEQVEEKLEDNSQAIKKLMNMVSKSIPKYYEQKWLLLRIKKIKEKYPNLEDFNEAELIKYREWARLAPPKQPQQAHSGLSVGDLLLLDFSGKFKKMPRRRRKYDEFVLNEETLRIENIHEKFAKIFLEYVRFLSTPVDLENPVLPSLVDNFYEHCLKHKLHSERLGYRYQIAENLDESQLSVEIKEILHIKGLQIVRELNFDGPKVVIKTNNFDAGFIEYSKNLMDLEL